MMATVRQLGTTDVAIVITAVTLLHLIIKRYLSSNHNGSLPLNGPPGTSRIFGLMREMQRSEDVGLLFETWAAKYGPVFKVPTLFGGENLVVLDPKAITQFYSKETTVYVGTKAGKRLIATFLGKGLLWAEGESHRRQRRALSPAFSNAALRRLTSVFYDSAYKLKSYWDNEIENHPDGAIIEVQQWMNHVALDSVGIAGFSHDFGSLDGKPSAVLDVFESLGQASPTKFGTLIFLLSFVFPVLLYIPTKRNVIFGKMRKRMEELAREMLAKSKRVEESGEAGDKSIIGLLIKAENLNANEKGDERLHMTPEEVAAQVCYDTTSTSSLTIQPYLSNFFTIFLKWALIELSKAPEKQDRLRKELLRNGSGQDIGFDELMSSEKYPYLDAVVHETLRLHPPISETTRIAAESDVLPLSTPIIAKDGQELTSLAIPKGTTITSPISSLNRSELLWGKRAKEFIPERWINGLEQKEVIPVNAKSIKGHRHILTFSDGPRICLGRNFALSEFKSVLSVLIRSYTFEFPDGPETKISIARAFLPRPRVEGASGPSVPLRVRKVEVE
ncbi:cytochrome P450 [Marasmius fiardii PR-910]|nr:cytochrome P450 [Marasmius fiardii PR-910]